MGLSNGKGLCSKRFISPLNRKTLATILNAAPLMVAEIKRLRAEASAITQDNNDKQAVIWSQEGQIERLLAELAGAKAVGAAEWLEFRARAIDVSSDNPWIDLGPAGTASLYRRLAAEIRKSAQLRELAPKEGA